MEFRIIFSLQYSISINTFEVDPPPPSDSLHNAVVKPKPIQELFYVLRLSTIVQQMVVNLQLLELENCIFWN